MWQEKNKSPLLQKRAPLSTCLWVAADTSHLRNSYQVPPPPMPIGTILGQTINKSRKAGSYKCHREDIAGYGDGGR